MKKSFLVILPFLMAGSLCYAQKKTSRIPKKPKLIAVPAPPKIEEYKADTVVTEQRQSTGEAPMPIDVSPTIYSGSESNQFSNNKVLTKDDILLTDLTLKVDEKAKVIKDALLIYGSNGTVVSFDPVQKKVNWSYTEKGIKSSYDNKFSVDHATVYIPYADGTITALNVNTGALNWRDKIGMPSDNTLLVKQNAMLSNGLVYVASKNSNFYAIDKINGSMVWNYRLDYKFNIYPPVAANNAVYINNAPYVYKFEARTGKGIWRRGFKKAMYAKMLADKKYLYATNESSTLSAVDLNDPAGAIAWEFNLEDNQYGVDENIILNNGVIYLAGKSNPDSKASSLYAVNAADGKKLWRADLPKKRILDISLIDNQIYGYMEDNFFVINTKDGKLVFTTKPEEEPVSNIISESPKTVLYMSRNGLVRYYKSDKRFELLNIPELKTEKMEDRASIQFVKKVF